MLEEHPVSPLVAEVLRLLVWWGRGDVTWKELQGLGLALDE